MIAVWDKKKWFQIKLPLHNLECQKSNFNCFKLKVDGAEVQICMVLFGVWSNIVKKTKIVGRIHLLFFGLNQVLNMQYYCISNTKSVNKYITHHEMGLDSQWI